MSKHVTRMTIDDAEHYSPEQRAAIIKSYPLHEREARAKGVPMLGSGRIFPIPEEDIKVEPFQIPYHWPRLAGADFGWDHPFAAAWGAIDRDTDTLYIYDCFRVREQTPSIHAITMRSKGEWIPVAWPHDGLQHDKGSGDELADQYKKAGVKMLPIRAQWPDGGNSVEAGLLEILDRMQTGRFKVFNHLNEFFEEFRLYHRKDGKIVKLRDDIISAIRYLVMMLRYARIREKNPQQNIVHYGVLDAEAGY